MTSKPSVGPAPAGPAPAFPATPNPAPEALTKVARPRSKGWVAYALSTWHWRHPHPAWAAANAAGATLGATAIAAAAGIPGPFAAIGGALGAAGAVASGMVENQPGRRLVWRGCCWFIPGMWSCTTLMADAVWSPWALGALAAGTAGAATAATAIKATRKRRATAEAARAAAADADARRNRLAAIWEARIARVTSVKATIRNLSTWPTRTGFTLDADLPPGGATWRDIARHTDGLATDARLPHGCEVTVEPGHNRGAVLLHVSVVNALEQDYYLDDYTPLSINNPLSMGRLRNGESADINLRYACGVLVGQTDSGKTNQLQTINTQLVRCMDAIVWQIDLAGGGLSRPWVTPYIEGRAPRPAVDWVATDIGEAELMCKAAIEIINGRKPAYRDRMRAANDDKIPVGADVPEIVIVVDEIKTVPPHVVNMLAQISDTGRAAGVRTLCCALRATDDYLPIAIKEQARVRIGMRVSEEKELNYLYGWKYNIDTEAAPYQGCGFVLSGKPGEAAPLPFKGYRTDPGRIDAAAVATAGWRPDLDPISQDLADKVAVRGSRAYTDRWARVMPKLFTDDITIPAQKRPAPTHTPPTSTTPASNAAPAVGGDAEDLFAPIPGDTVAAALQRLTDITGRSATELGITTTATAVADDPAPELLTRALAVTEAAGGRIHSGPLAEQLGIDVAELGTELGRILRDVGVERHNASGRVRVGETSKPGYLADTLREAVDAYRAGKQAA
ncbi:hypothetical protein AB0M79_22120 [Polymorphospora sp. NPDC051019]|uniref:hypothetical protein n=1 Tax=Polymorphospora sp. NPDC051019 TaxID=3155725 RepID=UPI00343E089A